MPNTTPPERPPTTADPATSRWISEATVRHTITLLVCAGLIAAGDLFGARVDWRALLVMGVWIAVNLVVAPWAARPVEFRQRLWRYALTLVIDVLFLGVVYFFLDAVQWLGAVFFMHSALVASATLPRRWARAIAVLIAAVYSGLVLLAVTGPRVVRSPLGLPSLHGNYAFAVAAILATLGLVFILMILQERIVETIRDTAQRYLLLVRAAPDMVMTFDEEGRFLEVNPATLEQTGYTWEEIKRLPNTSFFPSEEWPKIIAARQRNIAGETFSLDVRYVRKSGEVRWLQTTSAPFRRAGDRAAVLVIARDVTDARLRTDELRENQERFRLIVNSLDLGFFTVDRDQRLTAIYGRWADEQAALARTLIGQHASVLVPSEAAAVHEAATAKALTGEDVTFEWSAHTGGDGGERFYRAHLAPVRDADGEVVGAAGVWTDETEVIRTERERESLRARIIDAERIESLGKLVSGVAHELNNPLAAILNFTEDLLADPRADDERIALEVIQAQALRSRTIVRDLLTFVRKGERRARRPEAPGPILETLLRAVRPGMATQGVSFVSDIRDGETPMLLDRAGFEQVVTNLLTNAAQAAGAGGAVGLAAQRAGDWYEVVVEDNGAGIREEHFGRIFEPFFTTKATGQGVGLGLSVSFGIVQAHEGTLVAENRPPASGGGARFTMCLPVSETPVAVTAPAAVRTVPDRPMRVPSPPRPLGPLPPRRPTLLIIDDEESIRRALRRYFERRGWAVDEAPDGTDALVKLLRPDAAVIYDVILCDLKMPGVRGWDLFRRLEVEAPKVARRVILSTGDVSAPDVSDFLAGVTVPVLEKPFELSTLEQLAYEVRASTTASAPAPGESPPA